jgi:hypothetical protein
MNLQLSDLPTSHHSRVIITDFPTSWGYLPQDAETNKFIDTTIEFLLSHYLVDCDMDKLWYSVKLLDEKYDDCEIYAKETIQPISEFMLSFQNHDKYEIRKSFTKCFWNE